MAAEEDLKSLTPFIFMHIHRSARERRPARPTNIGGSAALPCGTGSCWSASPPPKTSAGPTPCARLRPITSSRTPSGRASWSSATAATRPSSRSWTPCTSAAPPTKKPTPTCSVPWPCMPPSRACCKHPSPTFPTGRRGLAFSACGGREGWLSPSSVQPCGPPGPRQRQASLRPFSGAQAHKKSCPADMCGWTGHIQGNSALRVCEPLYGECAVQR